MKKISFISLIVILLTLVSCSDFYKTKGTCISVTLPYYSKNVAREATDGDAEISEEEPAEPSDDDFEKAVFTLVLTSETGVEETLTGKSGEEILFTGLVAGVYSLKCTAKVGDYRYEGTVEEIITMPGSTTSVTVALHKVSGALEPDEEVIDGFEFIRSTTDPIYYGSADISKLPVYKNTLIKLTYSGVPSLDVKDGLDVDYYSKKDNEHTHLIIYKSEEAVPLQAGKKFTETVYLTIGDVVADYDFIGLSFYYNVSDQSEKLIIKDFTWEIEEVEELKNSHITATSTQDGIKFTVSKLSSDKYWTNIQIQTADGTMKIKPTSEIADSNTSYTLYWPFVENGAGTYSFILQGNYGSDDVYKNELFAVNYTGNKTGLSINQTKLDTVLSTTSELNDTANLKNLKFLNKSTSVLRDIKSIIPNTNKYYFAGYIYAGEWDWLSGFDLHSDVEQDAVNIDKLWNSGLDLMFLNSYLSVNDYKDRAASAESYRVEVEIGIETTDYPDQCFMLPPVVSNRTKFNMPTETLLPVDDNGCYVTYLSIPKKLNKGDYVVLSVKGRYEFVNAEGHPTSRGVNLSAAVQDKSYEEFWKYILTPWYDISYTVPEKENFNLEYGFYITEDSVGSENQFQINFFGNDSISYEEDASTGELIEVRNYIDGIKLVDFDITYNLYSGEEKSVSTLDPDLKALYSTIVLPDNSSVAEYQNYVDIALPIDESVLTYNTLNMDDCYFSLSSNVNTTCTIEFMQIKKHLKKTYEVGNVESSIYIPDSEVLATGSISSTADRKFDLQSYRIQFKEKLTSDYDYYIVLTLNCLDETATGKLSNFTYTVTK